MHDSQRKGAKCPFTGEWINKTWPIHAMKYYSAIKRKDVWVHDATQMNLKDIMLFKGKKPRLYDSIHLKWPGQTNLSRQKVD